MKKLLLAIILGTTLSISAQELSDWTLQRCIDYAMEHNIQIRREKLNAEETEISLKQAKAALYPSLSFGTSHSLSNQAFNDVSGYSGSYNLNGSVSLYEGSRYKTIENQKLQVQLQNQSVLETQLNTKIQILNAFVEILFAAENLNIKQSNLELSEKTFERANAMFEAGSISRSELSQMDAQVSTDKYNYVVAQNSLASYKLALKQLLELGINDNMEIATPNITEDDILVILPTKNEVYEAALAYLPEVQSAKLSTQIAETSLEQAKTGYHPTLSLNAGVGTGASYGWGSGYTGSNDNYGVQLKNQFNESIGLSLNVPLYDKSETKTAVQKAKVNITSSELNEIDVAIGLMKEVENACLDAQSAQNQYVAAKEKLQSAEVSYELIEEQFYAGFKNTVELLTAKNTLLTAQLELIQAKYTTVLNLQLLNYYQNKPIVLN